MPLNIATKPLPSPFRSGVGGEVIGGLLSFVVNDYPNKYVIS